MAETAETFGSLELVIANAGALTDGLDDASWHADFETDLLGRVHSVGSALSHLRRAPGATTSSSNGSGRRSSKRRVISGPDPEDAGWGRVVHRASATKLAKLLKDGPAAFGYTYDMGDDWERQVIVERLEAADPDTFYPVFLGGEWRCPPEDCGSVPGYHDVLAAISAPDRARAAARSGRC